MAVPVTRRSANPRGNGSTVRDYDRRNHGKDPAGYRQTAPGQAVVTESKPQDITGMLADWNGGDPTALDRLMAIVYPTLRRIAHRHLERRQPGESLESAALANEAYLRLVRAGGLRCENRAHFLALCSQIMRRILVDHARHQGFAKRGGGALRVTLDEALVAARVRGVELFALDEALEVLAQLDRRKARVVELRYFGGLSVEETAEVLEVSVETVKRDWRLAKAWLLTELTRTNPPDEPA